MYKPRTSPLSLRKPDSAKRRTTSRPASSRFSNSNSNPIFTNADHANPQGPVAAVEGKSADDSAGAAAAGDTDNLPPPPSGPSTTTAATAPSAAVRGASGPAITATAAPAASTSNGVAARGEPGLLLSWEDVWFSLPRPGGRCWPLGRRRQERGLDRHLSTDRLTVLTGVSGFAGPSGVAAEAPEKDGGGGGAAAATAAGSQGSGSVTAIMGPSGAGKTTLLNVLAGRHRTGCGGCGGGGGSGAVAGTVRLNGKIVSAADVRGVSGYVTQEDVLPETLTCFEHLMFHAELRMSTTTAGGGGRRRRVAREDRKDRVLEVGLFCVRFSRGGVRRRRYFFETPMGTRVSCVSCAFLHACARAPTPHQRSCHGRP